MSKWHPPNPADVGTVTGVTAGDNSITIGGSASAPTVSVGVRDYPQNVKYYGAKGDGTTDDTAAITAAFNAAIADNGTVFFPDGTYKYTPPLSFTIAASITVLGSGRGAVLAPAATTTDGITLTGQTNSRVEISGLALNPSVVRVAGATEIVVASCAHVMIHDIVLTSQAAGVSLSSCSFVEMHDCHIDVTDGSTRGPTALRITNCGGVFTGLLLRSGSGVTGYTNCKPPLYITGANSELSFVNCNISGAGPKSQWTVSGVVSNSSTFTVTTTAPHDFKAGDFIVMRGMSPATYNNMWRVTSVGSTTVVVTTTANPGTSTVNGTAESVATTTLISNEDSGSSSSINESRFTGCLFEAIQTGLYGSACFYMDGRRGNNTQAGSISSWVLTGNYYDQYAIGLLLSGKSSNAANEPTVSGISVAGGTFNNRTRSVHLDQVQGITLTGLVCCVPGSVAPPDDGVSTSAGLYIYAGPGAPLASGIQVVNCMLGMGRNWQSTNNTPFKNGVLLDSPTINNLLIVGNQIFGSSAGIGEVNSPQTAAQTWKIESNAIAAGATFPPTNTELVPSIASATAIAIGYQDVQRITGTTTITTIVNGGWPGRRLTLTATAAFAFGTGGNIAITAPFLVVQGQTVVLAYDGQVGWYVG